MNYIRVPRIQWAFVSAPARVHLLFVCERYPPDIGGVAASARRISCALAELDVDVDLIAWTRSLQPGVVTTEQGNPTVYRMGRFRDWDSTMPHTLNLVDWLGSMRPYDAVWGHYLSPAGFFAAWIGRLKNIPLMVSIRGNDLDRDMFPPGDFARLLWTVQHADCITAVTQDLARKVAALSGRNDVVYLPNAVDHEVFRPLSVVGELRASLGIREDEVVLGFAGELREKKGQQYLLQALRKVQESRPACLLVIGEVRPSEMPRLMQWLGAGSLDEQRVLVTGPLASPADVNQHLQLATSICSPRFGTVCRTRCSRPWRLVAARLGAMPVGFPRSSTAASTASLFHAGSSIVWARRCWNGSMPSRNIAVESACRA